MESSNFSIVTESGGERVSHAQLHRFYQRYIWASHFCVDKDVLEMACGTGPGLGYLQSVCRKFSAGDIDPVVLDRARRHYGQRIDLLQFDASKTPYDEQSFDVIILFEAIYYVADVDALLLEVRRLLRPGGLFLMASANKDLFDFNPSPFSHFYFNPPELRDLLATHGFSTTFYAGSRVTEGGHSRKLMRVIKKVAVSLKLIPRSMKGKRLLKRLVFGKLVEMPYELRAEDAKYQNPIEISSDHPDTQHQVIYSISIKG